MSKLFGGSTPTVQAPPPVPQVDDAISARNAQNSALTAQGRATTLLTGGGDNGLPNLGQVSKPSAS